ncbi:MAG TPA: hypothetical protein VIH15_08775 [Casimicrobiaceae bacterium]|jgi:hypothetical protein
MKYVGSAIVISICGGLGALIGWTLVSSLDVDGVGAALAMVFTAMVAATALFAAAVALGRALHLLK